MRISARKDCCGQGTGSFCGVFGAKCAGHHPAADGPLLLGHALRFASRLNLALAFVGMAIAVLTGCRDAPTTPGRQSQQSLLRRADRGEALLTAAAAQLADLPSAVDTEIRPPVVILDSTKSADRQDVLAVCLRSPNAPDSPINIVSVQANNSQFRTLGVKSGDILKFYLLRDETVDEERRQAGFSRLLAMDFTVTQVIDNNTLLIEKGIPAPVVKNYMNRLAEEQKLSIDASAADQLLIPAKIEVWRNLDDRLKEINEKLRLYAERRLPPVGWQPSPDAQVLSQIVAWLNQWLRQSEPKTDWVAAASDPLLDGLDAKLLADEQLAPLISAEALAATSFQPYDGRLLQEAVWLRDISRWAPADNFNDLDRASALFDWTVRNVQLEADDSRKAHRPWQVLLYGRGTANQRAWVFAMLARQQGIDVVMLKAATAGDGDYWLPAVVVDNQLHIFDARLGLAIPGPAGKGVATLQQIQKDDSLLRQLDLDDAPYPLTAGALQAVVPHIVADEFDLSRRAWQVESKLTGDDRLVLTSRPSELAERLNSVPGMAEPRLWDVPFRTLRDQLSLGKSARHREALAFEPFAVLPVLWKARTRHFQGRRAVNAQSDEASIDDHHDAARLYTSKSVRPPDRDIAKSPSADESRIKTTAKLNAAYWLGLLSFDDEKYDVASHWLGRPELTAAESPWAAGARYNLARALEVQEKLAEAITLLEQDSSPQRHGNRLRARWLKSRSEEPQKIE